MPGDVLDLPLLQQQHAHRHQRQQRGHAVGTRRVPAISVETQREAQQVDHQRQHPHHRERGDVLRQVVGEGHQRITAQRRHCEPAQRAQPARRGYVGLRLRRCRAAAPPQADDAQRQHIGRIGHRPGDALRGRVQPRLDQPRVGQQRDQRGPVRQREQPVWVAAPLRPGAPGLQQRAGHGQQRERQADGQHQQAHDLQPRAGRLRAWPGRHRHDRQQRQAAQQQRDVAVLQRPAALVADEVVREGIAQQQRSLEEHQAGGPHRHAAAKARQDQLGDDRLHQEQQEGTEEDGDAAQCHARLAAVAVRRWRPFMPVMLSDAARSDTA